MSVQILTDLESDRAAIYDSTREWALGPIFIGEECVEQAEVFLRWLDSGAAKRTMATGSHRAFPLGGTDGTDARHYTPPDLKLPWETFLAFAVDEDGCLNELLDCHDCGHWCRFQGAPARCLHCGSLNTTTTKEPA